MGATESAGGDVAAVAEANEEEPREADAETDPEADAETDPEGAAEKAAETVAAGGIERDRPP
jgi:hypothetical protein